MLSVRQRYMVWVPECYRQPVSVSWGLHSCTQCLPGCVLWHWHTWDLCIEHVLKCRLGKSMFCLENEKAVFWTRPYFEHRFWRCPKKSLLFKRGINPVQGVYIYINGIKWACLKILHPTRDVWLGGMIRGYDWGYDSWVWFEDLDLVFPCILHIWLFTHTYPENVSTVGNYNIHGALWSWHAVDCWRFDAGIYILNIMCVCVCGSLNFVIICNNM